MDTCPDHRKERLNMVQKKPCTVLSLYATWNVRLARLYLIHSLRFLRKVENFLESNIKDEDNHDLALGYIANAIGVDDKAEAEAIRLKSMDSSSRSHNT